MEPPLRILHLEDDPNDAELIQLMFEAEGVVCDVMHVETRADFLSAIEQGGFDLILTDHVLPSFDGLSALKIAQEKCLDVPFIFVSGKLGEELAIETLKSGATDYVLKDRLSRIVPSARRALREAKERIERKRAEEALRKSEERFRLLVEGVKDYAIFMLDTDGYVVSWNAEAERIKGYRVEEIIGKHSSIFYPAEDVQHGKPQHELDIAIAEGRCEDEGWRVRKDGSKFWANVVITALRDEDGNLRGFSKVTRDITERKQAEESLREALVQLSKKNRYETIISTVIQSVHKSINFQDVLENAVEAMSKNIDGVDNVAIYLVEGEEAVLKTRRGFPDWYVERAGRIPYPKGFTWKTIIDGKPRYCIDVDQEGAIGPAGREIGIKSYLSVPIFFKGKTVGALNISSFQKNAFGEEILNLLEVVTHQIEVAINNAQTVEILRRSEQEIRKLNEELEQRLIELTNINKELEAFSYSVSHDLRAPLRAIDGFSRILLEDYSDKLDDEGKRRLNIIRSNTQNMGQLIDDLLAFSRLGRQDIKPSNIGIAELAKAVFEELKPNTLEQTLQLKINTLPPAHGDRAMIHQVFVNLLSNAIKFTKSKGTAVIEVGSWVENEENIYYVRDNGVGFDMQYANKLFGVFQRLHTTDEFEGTGVGLALVQRIIHRHSGRVWAEGKVNEGATFYFTLPREGGNIS